MVRFVLTICGYVVGLPLELLVIAAMLHGGYRRFPAVFAYVIAEFLATVVEMPLATAYYRTHDRHIGVQYVFWYWADEIILQFLVFAVVLSLIWMATSAARTRRALRVALIAGTFLFVGISFLANFDSQSAKLGEWMTPWARDLDFGAAILDMMLWAMLIAKRQKDSRILMLSGGLGVMFTGEAIGESVRTLSTAAHSFAVLPSNILMILTNLAFLYIWWQTFRAPRGVPLPSPVESR
jgi:hypothetical protein